MKASKPGGKSVRTGAKPLPAGAKSPDGPGLRQRKLQETRERLTRAAMALFLERGFEATTIDDIATAADVSRRSFFHYFASKEDVVVQHLGTIGTMMTAEMAARPADEPIAVSLRQAMAAALSECTPIPPSDTRPGAGDSHAVKALRVVHLVLNTPALYARFLERQGEYQAGLAAQIARRRPGDDLYPALAAGMALTALLAVLRRWSDSAGAEDPIPLLDRAFEQLGPAL